jgi:hypothetical protein
MAPRPVSAVSAAVTAWTLTFSDRGVFPWITARDSPSARPAVSAAFAAAFEVLCWTSIFVSHFYLLSNDIVTIYHDIL